MKNDLSVVLGAAASSSAKCKVRWVRCWTLSFVSAPDYNITLHIIYLYHEPAKHVWLRYYIISIILFAALTARTPLIYSLKTVVL